MTTARGEGEREVLATLLLDEKCHENLPEGFNEEAFELNEYRDLYRRMLPIISSKGKISEEALLSAHPEIRTLVDRVLWAASPLNGRFRAKANALMRHQPEQPSSSEDSRELAQRPPPRGLQRHSFDILNGMEIVKMKIPEQSFVVKDLISEQSVNFLSGEEGCGKSLLAMNLAISVAVGAKRWLGYDLVKQGKVVYLNNEMALSAFAKRLKSMADSLPTPGSLEHLFVPREVSALSDCWEALNHLCEQTRPCLIILDCLYFSHDKDENDSSAMKALMRQFLTLRDRYNTAVLLVHHTKKGSQYSKMHNDQMRGSNVFGGITDTVLQMRRSGANESQRIIKPTKFRHVSDENRKCRLLSLDPVSLWFRDEGKTNEEEHISRSQPTARDEIDFLTILKPGEEVNRKEVLQRCKSMGYNDRTIDRLLNNALVKGVLKSPKYGAYAL